ncbi:Gag-Pol polyprotein [Chionoecetes opilio]|uniref:Gag-Pol polyprotein n=1 Tax=Chionoecetes opilio TaxID=41210 RepID=A0A8J4YC48_CHIOP|nr:Gag-Pol polyprotein [Chionoecetes opilio]
MWMDDRPPTRLFESVSADYFHVADRTYVVYVDRLSSWSYVITCSRTAFADHLVRELRHLFSMIGVPTILRTDGGPQFASSTVRRFLYRWEVRHEMSSPTYARANGHAEAAVKTIKKLIMAATTSRQLDDDAFERGLLELRNTPRASGRSAAQVLFRHPLRSGVPTHHRAFAPEWQRAADECDARADNLRQQTKQRHDQLVHFMAYTSAPGLMSRTTLQAYGIAQARWSELVTGENTS